MSKLAAVHSGQPTQGMEMGRAPGLASCPSLAPTPESFSQELSLGDTSVSLPTAVNPRNAFSAAHAATSAAWLSLSATEIEVRKYFRKTPVSSGLEILAKMRHQCDLAAETLQQRMDEGNTERCTGCGKTLEEARKSQWVMMGSDMDPETGVPVPYRFCGPMCVRERNKERMLPKEERNKLRFDGQDLGDIR